MKTSARFLAMLLAVLMIAGAALSVSAFSDVTAATEHATAISVLNQLGVIGGYEDGTFKPEKEVTRAEMAKLVYVLYTTFQDAGKGSVKFDDVAADNWATGYISWCFNKGIIGGYGNGKFGPADNVTYDQALKMVCGTLGYNEWDSALWPVDVRTKALRDLDLGEGIPATVKGDQALTRGQVAQIMYNALSADMAETKMTEVVLNGTKFFSETPKQLKADIWGYNEVLYVATATDADEKTLTISKVKYDANGDRDYSGYSEVKANVKLADLGLAAYEGKTNDLIGLDILTVTKDGKMLPSATVKGSVIDNVAISYATGLKTLKINGVEYTAEDFAAGAEHPIAFVGNNAVKVFADAAYLTSGNQDPSDKEDCLTKAFIRIIKQSNLVRIIDKDGDGHVDEFKIEKKSAYKVTDVKADGTKKVMTAFFVPVNNLSATATKKVVADIVGAELKKDDVFVAAQMGDTLYVEVVAPVETYATKLSADTITLKDGGAVKFGTPTINNVPTLTFANATTLGEKNKCNYYVYNGEVILSEASGAISEYNFAILQEIKEEEGELDTTTMTVGKTYVAVLLIDGVATEFVLDNTVDAQSNGAHTVSGVAQTAAQLYATYKMQCTYLPGTTTIDNTVPVQYNYALVAGYEKGDNGYVLTINKNLDANNYVVINAGANLVYNSTTELYSFAGTNYTTIDLADNSVIYYTYTKSGNAHRYLGSYDKSTITKKSFGDTSKNETAVTTAAEAYLLKNEDGTYVLLATIVTGEINGTTAGVKTMYNDGRHVLYASEASSAELAEDGKTYNSYVFMDVEKLADKEAALDKTYESDNANAVATAAGYFYGWDDTQKKYVKVDNALAKTSVVAFTLDSIVESKGLINVGNNTFIKVNENTVIWGLAEDDKLNEYKAFTLADLASLDKAIDDYNGVAANTTKLAAIRGLAFQYVDENNDTITTSIVVDTYAIDDETNNPYLVNGTIINNYGYTTPAPAPNPGV